jgi:DNA-binding MarR family transcriptional regulator
MLARETDAEDRRRARFTLTAAGKKIDRERRGTVEAATRRALARAGAENLAGTLAMIALLIEELDRPD